MKTAKTHKVTKTTRRIMGRSRIKIIFRGNQAECEAKAATLNKLENDLSAADELHALVRSTYAVSLRQ